jgi:hypothetical protein
MSLREEFYTDAVETFLEQSEFAQVREFAIFESHPTALEAPGGPVEQIFTTNCVWDTEILKDRAIVQQQGLFLGNVRCFILSSLFRVEPRPEQIIYTRRIEPLPQEPQRKGWRIIDVTDAEEMYYIDLDKLIA